MTKTVRVGFVGAGFVGQVAHIANYLEVPGCELTAICETRPKLRQMVQQRYGFRYSYGHHTEMLDADTVDAVVIVVPRSHIGPIALDCLKSEKHVLTEKPMAGSLLQARELVNAARNAGRHYVVGYQRLHDEGISHALSLIKSSVDNGEMGKLNYVRAHCFGGQAYCNIDGHVTTEEPHPGREGGWPSAPEWLDSADREGFAFYLNTYCHNANLLRHFAGGGIPEVRTADIGRHDAGIAVLDFNGVLGVLETGRFSNNGWDEVTEAYFERGRIRAVSTPSFIRNVAAAVEIYRGGDKPEVLYPQMGHTWSFRRQAAAFVRTVAEELPSVAAGEDAICDLEMVEAIWRHYVHYARPATAPRLASAG